MNRAENIWRFECVHDQVGEALNVSGEIAIGDIVQVEEKGQEVAHDAEAACWAIIVAECGEFSSLQATYSGHLALGKVRRIGEYPVDRVC